MIGDTWDRIAPLNPARHAALPPRPVVDRFVSRRIDLQGFGTVLVAAFIRMTSSDAPYRTW